MKKGNHVMNYDYENQATGQKEPEGMRVLVVEPWKEPYLKTISGDLKSLQREVGGLIDATYPFEDMVAIVLNGEGKLNGMMPNRGLYNEAPLFQPRTKYPEALLLSETFLSRVQRLSAPYLPSVIFPF